MGLTVSNKEIDKTSIKCNETFKVKLSLTAAPDIVTNPTDIVLILDRSGSMAGSPLTNLKNGANKFIDIIDEATDGTQDGQIGNGSKIGIVSFADTATQNTQLITSVADLKAAVNSLTAGGATNHEDAFTKALDLFDMSSTNAKVMVMFTDGLTTAGGNPVPVTVQAKAQGVIIYCIGLSGNGGIDVQALNEWSSDPDSAYVAITPNDAELEDLFEDLANNITKPGATHIVVTDVISDCFKITAISAPSKGTATLVNANTVRWGIDDLGVTQSEGATFEFTVQHNGVCTGTTVVNESITYIDTEGNTATFPNPSIEIDCSNIIIEPCPEPIDVSINGCEDSVEFDLGDVGLEALGHIFQFDVTLNDVCPNKRVALAILLNEIDCNDEEHTRGMKTITIPALTGTSCQNVTLRCIKFVLPGDLDEGSSCAICNTKKYKVRLIANYIDFDFKCCNLVL
ncbi:MAG: VWA domain-containing protein [Anaeroplasmataceae bacterium]|nr:VWA domain-containing protein [Anaeroplasmataceae bacterium]